MSNAKRYLPSTNAPQTRVKRGIALYLFLLPLFLSVLVALFQVEIKAFVLNLATFVLFYVVIHLSKKGFEQEAKYHTEVFIKAPKIKYKTYSAYLLGGVTFFASFVAGAELFWKSVFLGVVAFFGYYLYYGLDPADDKLSDTGDVSADFVLESLADAKEKIDELKNNHAMIEDSALSSRLQAAINKAEEIVKMIENDPKIVRIARKFLVVYLDGITKTVTSYSALDEHDVDPHLKEKMLDLMQDLEETFEQERERLKQNDQFDLDVHIDTLKAQINKGE